MDPKIPGGERAVRRLLRKRRRPSALERDELAQCLRTSYRCTTAREALDLAIERGLHGYDGRLSTIIRRCDVDGELTHTVASELYLSPRQFFRYRSEAVEAVGVEIERAIVADETTVDGCRKDAQHAYVLGRYLLQRFDRADCHTSIAWLERATSADPHFLRAWTGLAAANVSLALASTAETGALARARECVRHAADLAPGSAQVQAANAGVTLWETRNAGRARELALDALDRDDRTAHAHFTLAWAAVLDSDLDAAERSFARAAAMEPESFRYLAAALTVPFFAGRYAETVERARELLDIEPNCGFVLGYLAEALNALGRYGETMALAAPVYGDGPRDAAVMTAYARALALCGEHERALDVRRTLNGSAVMLAAIDLALGEPARALDVLERAVDEDNGMLAIVDYDPAFESLRAEPRLERLVAKYTR